MMQHAGDSAIASRWDTAPYTPATPTPAAPAPAWSLARRLAFRFTFAYLTLYGFFLPLSAVALGRVDAWNTALWSPLVQLVAEWLLGSGTRLATAPTGSGDRLFDWMQVLCMLAIAVIATAVWSVADRRRVAHPRLFACLHAFVRYGLGVTLLTYGVVKVIPVQFPPPGPEQMIQRWGDFTPMGVLWTFMGSSAAYTIFTGLMEMAAGALLLVRRTALLGALLAAGVMANVVALNLAYDVPVKQFSAHLLLMALFLALPGARRLFDALVMGRAVPAVEHEPLVRDARLRIAGEALRLVAVAGALLLPAREALAFRDAMALERTLPMYGLYDVVEFARDGAVVPPLVTDGSRWRRVVIAGMPGSRRFVVQLMNDSLRHWSVDLDTAQRRMTGRMAGHMTRRLSLAWTPPADTAARELQLRGQLLGDSVAMRLRRVDLAAFRVRAHGFRWINEAPYAR